jgi:hypothetical protein
MPAEGCNTFTSLEPMHDGMMLDLPTATRARYNVNAVTKLIISSALVRREAKFRWREHLD